MLRHLALPAFLLLSGLAAPAAHADSLPSADAHPYADVHPYPADLLERVRRAARMIPGDPPTSIHYMKVAESLRPMAEVIEGGSQERFVSARSAFQVVYPSGWVMLDSGMDEQVHRFFGEGHPEPYWPERNAAVQAALKQARLILITHEHGDHVAGVIRTDSRRELAAKTMLTREQVQTLTEHPQMPEIRITPEMAQDYIVIDYEVLLPVAPGIVLIKAAGHTPGHQMIYVKLDSGREFLFIGDVAWAIDNVTQLKTRPASTMERVHEYAPALRMQLQWIQKVMEQDDLIVIPSHDDRLLQALTQQQLLSSPLVHRSLPGAAPIRYW